VMPKACKADILFFGKKCRPYRPSKTIFALAATKISPLRLNTIANIVVILIRSLELYLGPCNH